MPRGMIRVARSRSVMNSIEASATRLQASKPARPGRMTIITPMKPTPIAAQRRQPTCSPKKIAAPAVTISGTTWRMALMLAIGMLKSARMNRIAAKISATVRQNSEAFQIEPDVLHHAGGDSDRDEEERWRTGRGGTGSRRAAVAGLASLISVSLIRNRRFAAEIARMPRRFSRKVVIACSALQARRRAERAAAVRSREEGLAAAIDRGRTDR